MIINVNISGKETPEQISKMAMETMETFQEDLTPRNGDEAIRVMDFYRCLGLALLSTSHVNVAMNEAKGDPQQAIEIMKRLRNECEHYLAQFTNGLIRQINEGVARAEVHKL